MKLNIEKLDNFGSGLGFIEDKITFVKNALPNEVVDVTITNSHKKYNEASINKIITKSNRRVEPVCPYFSKCGGCHLQHLSYLDTLNYKKGKVDNILKINKIEYKVDIISNESPFNYRNKLSLKISNKKIGFYEESSHTLVEIDKCLIAKQSINEILEHLNLLNIINGNITIRSNYNNEILLIIETNDNINIDKIIAKHNNIIGIILNNKCIYGVNFFYERINGYLFKVSYDAFFQVNYYITSKLFDLIKENIIDSDVVLDLYSGVGTLGIIASSKAKKVYSIEIVKNAIFDNIENKKINNISNIYPMLGDVKDVINKIKDKIDLIIIDPPRKGIDKSTLEVILNSNAKRIIYISCDPNTLGRDLNILNTKYKINKITCLDMFSYTYHVETFCILEKR